MQKVSFEPEDFPPAPFVQAEKSPSQWDSLLNEAVSFHHNDTTRFPQDMSASFCFGDFRSSVRENSVPKQLPMIHRCAKPLPPSAISAPEFVPKNLMKHGLSSQCLSSTTSSHRMPENMLPFPTPQAPNRPQLPVFPPCPVFNGQTSSFYLQRPQPPPPLPVFPLMQQFPALPDQRLVQPVMRPVLPHFLPANHAAATKQLLPKSLSATIPQGYSANLTTINAGPGATIPAIVLKKKRKKKNRLSKDFSSSNKSRVDESKEVPEPQEEEEELQSTHDGSPLAHCTELLNPNLDPCRRSEPDLMKIQKVTGANYPKDLDLLQSTASAVGLLESFSSGDMSTSCPDLSELVPRDSLDLEQLNFDEHRDQQCNNAYSLTQPSGLACCLIANPMPPNNSDSSNIQSSPANTDFEHDTNPVFREASKNAASDGHISSAAVRALDREIRREMAQNGRLPATISLDDEHGNDESDDENLFDRLVNEALIHRSIASDTKQTLLRHSLFDELEERKLFDSSLQQIVNGACDGLSVKRFPMDPEHRTVIVSERNGMRNAELVKKDSPPPLQVYADRKTGMNITVNHLDELSEQDPETLDDDARAYLNRAQQESGLNNVLELPPVPKNKTCCSIM